MPPVSAESSLGQRSRVLSVLIFVAAAVAVFYLPYLFPLKPTNSYSYVFGYNNRIAVVLVIGFAAAGALWTRGTLATIADAARDHVRVPRRDLFRAMAITLVLCLLMILLVGDLGGFNESGYDIYRLYLASLGKRPYRDFEWPFGVALLYIPLWTSRLLHTGQEAAFNVVWTVASLLSTAAVYAVVNRLHYATGQARRCIFWMLFVVSLGAPLDFGLHYVGLRYLIPILALLIVADWCRATPARVGAATVVLLASTAAMLLVSPEMAVAIFVAGSILLWPRNRFTRSAFSWPVYGAAVLGMAALLVLAAQLGVFNTARASGGGADSLPLIPSAGSLLFLVNVAIAFSALVWRWRHPDPEDNTTVLILASIPLLPAALGRADPGHLYTNGLGFVIAAIVYLWPRRTRYAWIALWAVAYVLPLAVTLPLSLASDAGFAAMMAESRDAQPGHLPGPATRCAEWALAHLPDSGWRRKQAARLETARQYPIGAHYDFAQIYPGVPLDWNDVTLDAPLGFDPAHSGGMYRSPQVDLGFYQGEENANTPSAVQRKITELAAHPDRPVLMPGHAEEGAPPIDVRAQQHQLSMIAGFPYRARPTHLDRVYAPLYEYVRTHYRLAAEPSPADYLYELWVPIR